jgi:hypothetical protein
MTAKKFAIAGLVVTLLATPSLLWAQDAPKLPPPQKEHEWLKQLEGEWETEAEARLEPGKPPMKSKGTESVRTVGGFWVVAENKFTAFDTPCTGVMTLGYDVMKKKYVGTWIDSMNSHLTNYEGTVDEAGKTLTLLAEGPDSTTPGKLSKFKDVIEMKSKDHKVLTSSIQGDDGKWVTFLTVNYRRKK